MPFLDDEVMAGPPNLDHAAFLTPKLRRSAFDPVSLVVEKQLGGGADGFVWRVRFGDEGPFALKVVGFPCFDDASLSSWIPKHPRMC